MNGSYQQSKIASLSLYNKECGFIGKVGVGVFLVRCCSLFKLNGGSLVDDTVCSCGQNRVK